MTQLEAIQARHSVRKYMDKPIPQDLIEALDAEISACNRESGLHMQLITGEEKAFGGMLGFSRVKNYIALVGGNTADFDEKSGYYGERIALTAQMLGLNTCWAAMSYSKRKCSAVVAKDEKLGCAIAVGFGATQGKPHRSKPMNAVCKTAEDIPGWFQAGVEAALLAPTAVNQQRFLFTLTGNTVKAETTGGPCCKIDLGIVKYHFEVGAGKERFHWA